MFGLAAPAIVTLFIFLWSFRHVNAFDVVVKVCTFATLTWVFVTKMTIFAAFAASNDVEVQTKRLTVVGRWLLKLFPSIIVEAVSKSSSLWNCPIVIFVVVDGMATGLNKCLHRLDCSKNSWRFGIV